MGQFNQRTFIEKLLKAFSCRSFQMNTIFKNENDTFFGRQNMNSHFMLVTGGKKSDVFYGNFSVNYSFKQ
jgi:hypothetical protein